MGSQGPSRSLFGSNGATGISGSSAGGGADNNNLIMSQYIKEK